MLWIKAFHIIFMVTWFAGLFYLPRLFVYHAQCDDQISHERFVIMEKKLFIIMTIGAVLTAVFGLILLFSRLPVPTWLQIKLALVATLIAYHVYCWSIIKRFRNHENCRTHVFYRWFNEFPAILLIAIVCLAVLNSVI